MTLGRLSLGPASAFACLLHVRLVCRLALLGRTILLPLLDCPSSVPWLPGAVDPTVAGPSRPRPRPRPARPLPRVGIWSMKEFCNLNCDARDVFVEFFH
jgi:hypothetical protein